MKRLPLFQTDFYQIADNMLEIPNDIFFAEVVRVLLSGNSVAIPMRGVSMLPFLKEGRDSVILKPIHGKCLKAGDVVLFRHKGVYKLHRFIDMKNGKFHMHGDGLLGKGEMCGVDDVMAVVTDIIRDNGKAYSTSSWRWKLLSFMWTISKPVMLRLLSIGKRLEIICC